MSRDVFCNVRDPDLYQIAAATGHKLTGFQGRWVSGQLRSTVKVDGVRMLTSIVRQYMLEGIRLYTFGNATCKCSEESKP